MKAAIIGFGRQGFRHYQALQELGVEVCGVIDQDPKAVCDRIPKFPIEKISADSEKLLKRFQPDVVTIATNAASRLGYLRHCVEADVKKVFCEKPMATSLKDALEMKRLAEAAGCLLCVNHLRRFNSNHRKLHKLLQEEDILGPIRHLYKHVGCVGLGNEGTHTIDQMRFYTNSEVEWVVGFIDQTGTPNPRGNQYRDPGGWGMIQFKNGARAFLDSCEDTGVPARFELVGTYGRVVMEELNNNWHIYARSPEDRKLPLTRYPTPLQEVPLFSTLPWDVKEFSKLGLKELIFEGRTSCTALDGYKALEAVIALHVSHRKKGERVFLPLAKEYHSLEIPWA